MEKRWPVRVTGEDGRTRVCGGMRWSGGIRRGEREDEGGMKSGPHRSVREIEQDLLFKLLTGRAPRPIERTVEASGQSLVRSLRQPDAFV
jgi:hypothetical protein